NMSVLLGEPMIRFHEALAQLSRQNPLFSFHYVTAREMYNLAKAAEAGWQGSVADALDFELLWNGAVAETATVPVVSATWRRGESKTGESTERGRAEPGTSPGPAPCFFSPRRSNDQSRANATP